MLRRSGDRREDLRLKTDGGLRKTLAGHLRVPDWHWTMVETGAMEAGVPDLHYASRGAAGWIETKWTDAWAVDVRPHQVAWNVSYSRAGGRSWFAVRRLGTTLRDGAYDELWILRGSAAPELQDHGLRLPSQLVVCRCSGGPESWDWGLLAAVLREERR